MLIKFRINYRYCIMSLISSQNNSDYQIISYVRAFYFLKSYHNNLFDEIDYEVNIFAAQGLVSYYQGILP